MKLKELIKEEVQAMLEASMTKNFRKAIESLQDVQLKQQQLQKAFVAEKNVKKKEKLKQALIKMHKIVQKAESEFNQALRSEPVELEEAKDNLYLQLHKKYADQIKGLKAKKIKKLTDLVSVQRYSMEERDDYFDMDSNKKKKLSAEYALERKLFKKYMAGDHSVMLPKGTEKLSESRDAYTLHRLANNVGQGSAEDFLEDNNVDIKSLAKAIQQKTIDKYTLRDIVKGTADKSTIKKFKKDFVSEQDVNELDVRIVSPHKFNGCGLVISSEVILCL